MRPAVRAAVLSLALASCSKAPGPPAGEPGAPAAVELTPEVAAKLREVAFQAARDGDVRTLAEYFAAGRPVDEVNARGDTLLTVAAYSGQLAAVELILARRGVAVDARNRMGLTALTAAAFKGHVPIAAALLRAGAAVDAASPGGRTALMFAALSGRAAMVDFLLEAGADPAAADAEGATPLGLARGQGAEDVARRLEAALAAKGGPARR